MIRKLWILFVFTHSHFPFFLLDGIFQQVQIIDTIGSDEFPAMRDVYIKNGDYFVVMYAVDNRQSFDMAFTLCQKVRDIKGKDFNRIMVVGNKIDLRNSRQVTTEDVLRKSINEKMYWFTETSAKLNCNIRCLFQIILKNYVKTNEFFLGKKDKMVSNLKSKNTICSRFKTRKISAQTLVYSLDNQKDKYMISD
ncbi:uncharacterized protein LOC125668875 [Ostrea edulis]|uniref:uncharacterized protein LOC125668875 n=1 Tax=Ostrea edulis TaxID=37623 RepID=UPI0020940FF1|nr:uncharacterized protein LOC125668875 [Ostrea edulis]